MAPIILAETVYNQNNGGGSYCTLSNQPFIQERADFLGISSIVSWSLKNGLQFLHTVHLKVLTSVARVRVHRITIAQKSQQN